MRTSAICLFTLAVALVAGCASPPTVAKAPAAGGAAPAPDEPPPVFALAATLGEDDDEEGVRSRITKVTVYSDRALVTREAKVAFGPEPTVHRFRKLPGWIDEGSVRAATSAGKIVDVSVERRFLARSTDEGFRKVEEKHRLLVQAQQALDDELTILEAQREHVESIKVFSLEKLPKDAATRDIDVKSYGDVITFVSDALRKTAERRRQVEAERALLAPEVEASARRLEELRHLTELEESAVLVTLQGPAAGEANLTLTYATPGATWEPAHELRATSDRPEDVELSSFAVVTQTTGEDWNHAELSFSTQSSSDAERIPELEKLALGETAQVTRKVTERTTSFSSAQKKYEEQNRHWNRLNQAQGQKAAEITRFEQAYTSNLAVLERVQSRTVEIFHGLQKRGTTAHFVAKDPAIVRSDGRSIRLPIGKSRVAARRQIIAAPEESLNAAVTLELENATKQPLLPGSVARYRDGAFLGMTDVDFVAEGETFSLFFSVADQIKLTRKLDRKQSSLVRRARNRMKLAWISTAENLSKHPVTLVLAERVPVAENTDVQVSQVRLGPSASPDAQGIVRWTVTLAPGERRSFDVSYQVDYPATLILDVQRKRAAPRPAAPKYDFDERIIELEDAYF